jgi:hypothetical protein
MGSAVMQSPRKHEGADGRPRLSVVISELRSRESGLDRERTRRLAAHPLEFDERGVPVDQLPLSVVERLGRLVAR